MVSNQSNFDKPADRGWQQHCPGSESNSSAVEPSKWNTSQCFGDAMKGASSTVPVCREHQKMTANSRRKAMQASDVMTTSVVTVKSDTPVADIAAALLKNRISAVPVVDAERRVLGIVSEGDLMRRAETGTEPRHSWWLQAFVSKREKANEYIKTHGRTAADVMSANIVTVTEEMPLRAIAQLLEKKSIKRVPVVRDGHLVGIISRANLLHGLAASDFKTASSVAADDRTIRETLIKELEEEVGFNSSTVNVVVSDGAVSIWGIVDSEAEIKAAELAAEGIPGVKSVENNLRQIPTWAWAY
jgi:CBS-domain-containing membrane protein